MEGDLRLMGGQEGPGYEYGRLEIFLRGFWSTVCAADSFTPDSAKVACTLLGFDGGAALEFRQAYSAGELNQVLCRAALRVGADETVIRYSISADAFACGATCSA